MSCHTIDKVITSGLCTGCGACTLFQENSSMNYTSRGPLPSFDGPPPEDEVILKACPGKGTVLYRPGRFFLAIASPFILFSLILGIRFIYRVYFSSVIDPGRTYLPSLILMSVSMIIGIVLLALGIIGELLKAQRKISEENLYYARLSRNFKEEQMRSISRRADESMYPPAKPGALRLLAPQRGLTAIGQNQNRELFIV